MDEVRYIYEDDYGLKRLAQTRNQLKDELYFAHDRSTKRYKTAKARLNVVSRLTQMRKQRLARQKGIRFVDRGYSQFASAVQELVNYFFSLNTGEPISMSDDQMWCAIGLGKDINRRTNNHSLWMEWCHDFSDMNLQSSYENWYYYQAHKTSRCGKLERLRRRLGPPSFELALKLLCRRHNPDSLRILSDAVGGDLVGWAATMSRRQVLRQRMQQKYREACWRIENRYQPILDWCAKMAHENWGEIHDMWAHPAIPPEKYGINWDNMMTVENPPPGFGTMALCTHGLATGEQPAQEMAEVYHLGSGLLRGLIEQGVDPNDLAWNYTELPNPLHSNDIISDNQYSLASLLLVQRIGPSEFLTQVGGKLWRGKLMWRAGWGNKYKRGYDAVTTQGEIVMLWGEFNPEETA